jgi:hypothetical protein
MTGMKKLAWELFEQTGEIGYYNLFKALDEK